MTIHADDRATPLMHDDDNDDVAKCHSPESGLTAQGLEPTPPEGLTSAEASNRLERFGFNELPEKERNACLHFLSYFWGPMPCMIWVAMALELAQALSGSSEHWTDFAVLFGLQVANGTVAFFEERNAGNAIAALKASLAPKAIVKRDGRFVNIDARELVPGDLVNLKLGNIVPADSPASPCRWTGPPSRASPSPSRSIPARRSRWARPLSAASARPSSRTRARGPSSAGPP
jgi:magnesium-transporting ATPase (P-type)